MEWSVCGSQKQMKDFCCRRLGEKCRKYFIFWKRSIFLERKYITFKTKYNICGFIDNAVGSEEEDGFLHIPVYNPLRLKELPQYDIYCVSADFISMWRQLKSLGISEHRIKFWGNDRTDAGGDRKSGIFQWGNIIRKNGKLLYSSQKYKNVSISSMEDIKEIVRESVKIKS